MLSAQEARVQRLERRHESRVRGLARRRDHRVCKSRTQLSLDNFGEFMLVDDRNCVVLGMRFDASLEDIEAYFSDADTAERDIESARHAANSDQINQFFESINYGHLSSSRPHVR